MRPVTFRGLGAGDSACLSLSGSGAGAAAQASKRRAPLLPSTKGRGRRGGSGKKAETPETAALFGVQGVSLPERQSMSQVIGARRTLSRVHRRVPSFLVVPHTCKHQPRGNRVA